MSTTPVASDESQDLDAKLRAPSPAYASVPIWVSELSDVVTQSFAATNQALIRFASRRLNENLSFSVKLGQRESALDVVRNYGSYCRSMLEDYHAAIAQLQLINLTLASEVLRARPLPVRSTQSPQERQTARPRSATRGSFS